MNFFITLLKLLPSHPKQAFAALYWYVTGRKVRGRNRLRLMRVENREAYQIWIDEKECLPILKERCPADIAGWSWRPCISVILYLDPTQSLESYERSIASVQSQFYDTWELILIPHKETEPISIPSDHRIALLSTSALNWAVALEVGLTHARGHYIHALEAGDTLSPGAFYFFCDSLQATRSVVLYGDEDKRDENGNRSQPYFKPEWNEELFLAQDYISHSYIIEKAAACAAGPVPESCAGVASYALLLQYMEKNSRHSIAHVPYIVCHRKNFKALGNRQEAVSRYLNHVDPKAKITRGVYESLRILWPLPQELPYVSIIIPTRDMIKLLRTCIEGLLTKTDYPNMEILIVDNQSTQEATRCYFRELQTDPRVRILSFPGEFNYSAINNFAVQEAKGSYVCLINNDTEIIHKDWLREMMGYAVRPYVGAVGAKLLYEDGNIQHAGVVIGLGGAAGHIHRFVRNDDPGYFNHPHLPQYMSAVTGACLLVEKAKFQKVGGLDALNFRVAFNDVDLCLKLRAAGWKNIYTPYALLIHHESKTRTRDSVESQRPRYLQELAVLQKRWGTQDFCDPSHNPNLSRTDEAIRIAL